MRVVEGEAAIDELEDFLDRLAVIADREGVTVQAFDARYVVGRQHLDHAVRMADRAIERGDAIARERSVEILLYAAGRRQIDRALEMGVGEGVGPVAVLVDAAASDAEDRERAAAAAVTELLAEERPTLEEYDEERVTEFFEVGPAERAATDATLADLVRERVALLAVEK